MADLFSSARLRIEGARDHIRDLEARAEAYGKTNPYATVIEKDLEDGILYDVHKIKVVTPIPEKIGLICAKAIEDLRSALDHTAYAAATLSNAPNLGRIYFPFGSSATYFDDAVRDNCKGIHDEIVALFRSFQPYKGGDDLLWAINPLRTCSEHRMIRPVGHGKNNAWVRRLHIIKAKNFTMTASRPWDGDKDEVEIFRVVPDDQFSYDVTVFIFIAFGDVEIVSGQPVVTVLNTLASKVEGIVSATEALAKQLGLTT